MTERKIAYDNGHAHWLVWRGYKTPEALAEGAHDEGVSIARVLQLMARGWIPIAFTWADQEQVVREMIKLQDDEQAAHILKAVEATLCKACAENDGICICP